jgi:hypothetical protein
MDAIEKKYILQFDDLPGVRQNAFEAWCEHLKKAGRTFRDFVADVENAMPADKAAEREKTLAEYIEANEKAQKSNTKLSAEVARLKAELKAALWIKANWKIIGGVAAGLLVVMLGYWSYERYWSRSESVNLGVRNFAASSTWAEGWGEPFAARVGGEPWWLMFRGDLDASNYSDNHGNPVEMRCLHVYGSPAQPDSGEYIKPSPWNFLGWMKWPELAVYCRLSPDQQADISR